MEIGSSSRVRTAATRAIAGLVGLLATACATGPAGTGTTITPTASAPTVAPERGEIRIAAVGDSITVADSESFPDGELGPASWVSYAVGDGVTLAGGWGAWGATTAEMAAAVEPVDADVLVVLAGTNDVATGVPFDDTASAVARIVATVGAEEVLVSAVPPLDARPEEAAQLNTDLEALAHARGWAFVDSAAGIREGARFTDGMSDDGVHPTVAGAERIGAAIRAAVVELAEQSPDAR